MTAVSVVNKDNLYIENMPFPWSFLVRNLMFTWVSNCTGPTCILCILRMKGKCALPPNYVITAVGKMINWQQVCLKNTPHWLGGVKKMLSNHTSRCNNILLLCIRGWTSVVHNFPQPWYCNDRQPRMLNEKGAKNILHQNLLFSDGQYLTDKKDAHCTAQTESFITARAISHLINHYPLFDVCKTGWMGCQNF